ncbi:MAG: hypothetical protein V7746_13275 [Halioglobus sp.]
MRRILFQVLKRSALPFRKLASSIVKYLFLFFSIVVTSPTQALVLDVTIEWGKGTVKNWDGTLTVTQGKFISVEGVLLEGDEVVKINKPNEISWTSEVGGRPDGVRVRLDTDENQKLLFKSHSIEQVFAVKDIVSAPQRIKLASKAGFIDVRRTTPSVFWGKFNESTSVLSPCLSYGFQWGVDGFSPGRLKKHTVEFALVSDLSGATIRKWNIEFSSDESRFERKEELRVPCEEGVYSIKAKIPDADFYLPQLRSQFVVVSTKPRSFGGSSNTSGKLVDSIDLTKDLAESRFLDDGTSRLEVVNQIQVRRTGEAGEKSRISRNSSHTMNWFAYKLAVKNPSFPHVLEVEYLPSSRQRFVISFLDEESGGQSSNLADVGVAHEGSRLAKPIVKKIVVWPQSSSTAVAIVNALQGTPAQISAIRLYELPNGLPLANTGFPSGSSAGIYLEEPRLDKIGGGPLALDTGHSMESNWRQDWVTFYTAISHIAQTMRFRGNSAIAMPVFSYGGTLYPSEYLSNNGRYDNGTAFLDARNVNQKDVVRLLLSIFESYGIDFYPIFVFYTALPIFEEPSARGKDGCSKVDLIHYDGVCARNKLRFSSNGELGPFYDPLHPEVQSQVANIAQEFGDRYAGSSALGNVIIQINPTGWTQYPGLSWGYHPDVVSRFYGENTDLNEETYPLSIEQNRSRDSRWAQWRNQALARFYEVVGQDLKAKTGKSLLMGYMNTFSGRFREDKPSVRLKQGWTVQDLLAVKGVDPLVIGANKNVGILSPLRTSVPFATGESLEWALVSRRSDSKALFQSAGTVGALEFHDYFESDLATLEERWWWPVKYRMTASFPSLDIHPQPVGAENPLIFSGGWQIIQ